ncbi:hypothetical protein [Amycolatopsis sp. H20-H5]|uniref:hypothetical protein n=1 Tax=Amycolatopsis sp. H20-H5 TaxID=3046309 RepID=UPI002DBD4FD5|nr:hypothetical protein [Amycolatopsis sp. H20-H5]MEC3974283.1 hypothetical protein [Amycolatopsis sp. H20-H5]
MEGDIRAVEGVVVASDSPAGRAAEAINDLTMHLPDPDDSGVCPTCAGRFWPCRYFDDAAHRVHTARLRVGDVVPLDLHPRLWPAPAAPATSQDSRAWPSDTVNEEYDHG